jgi:hypothetical protein
MGRHTVQQGECLLSIAEHYGFSWQTVWQYGENAELRKLRADPNILFPGDVVIIPDKDVKGVSRPTGASHRFVKGINRAKVKIRLLIDDQPLANTPFRLAVDGRWIDGATDAAGMLEVNVPPLATEGSLVFTVMDSEQTFPLRFGGLDPVTEPSGAMQRLQQLGFNTSGDPADAIGEFQNKAGLPVSGQMDDATRASLKDAYGQ